MDDGRRRVDQGVPIDFGRVTVVEGEVGELYRVRREE